MSTTPAWEAETCSWSCMAQKVHALASRRCIRTSSPKLAFGAVKVEIRSCLLMCPRIEGSTQTRFPSRSSRQS